MVKLGPGLRSRAGCDLSGGKPGRRMVKQQGEAAPTLPGETRWGGPRAGRGTSWRRPAWEALCHAGLATAHAATVHQSRHRTRDGGKATVQGGKESGTTPCESHSPRGVHFNKMPTE